MSEKDADVFGTLGCGPVGDRLYLLWLLFNSRCGDNKTAEVDAGHSVGAFERFCEDFFRREAWSGPAGGGSHGQLRSRSRRR